MEILEVVNDDLCGWCPVIFRNPHYIDESLLYSLVLFRIF